MNDELRRRARAARAEVEAQVDVDAELAGRPSTSDVAPITPLPPRRRLVAVAGSIAAVAVAIVGGVVLLRGSDSIETSDSTIDATTSIPSAIPTTLPGPTTVVPTTSSTGITATTNPAATAVAAVSYLDPPAATTLTPLGTVPVPDPTVGAYQVAVGDLGVAIATWPYDSSGGRVDVIGFDGSTRTVENLPTNGAIAYGPGDVVYSTVQGETIEDFAVVAMPLSGDRVGEIVASEPANWMRYIEYPPSSFGHGAEGMTMRRDGGEVAIGFVDVDGNPTTLDGEPPTYDIDRDLLTEIPRGGPRSGVVTSSEGDTWNLSVDKHPDAAETYVGPSPVAPTTDGDGVLWTHVGPDIAPEVDFGEPSQWVVAQLHPGGSAIWWSLPDGWTIAASDIWGTVAVRQTDDRLEVALVDFATDEPPTGTTTTTTTTSTTSTVPTTVPAATAVAWQTLTWEAAGIERDCSGEESVGCTQILVDRDGSIVSYDPTTRALTRRTTPAITAQVDEGLGDVALQLLGPDHIVYLNVDAAEPGDGAADLVAMSLAPDDAGRVLGRWAGITDRVGDQDLVATRDGLVVVGCCDHELLRPAPDAELVLPWIGRDGGTTSISGPVMRTEVDAPTLTVHRDDDLPAGTRTWSFDLPADWQPRGMPTVIPTFDGGFIATTYGTNQTITRGWVDGTITTVSLDTFEFPILDPNGRVMIADGDRFVRIEPFGDRTEYWAGRPEYGDDGTVTLPDIDTPIDAEAPWARNPIAFGNAVAGRLAVNERRTIEYVRPTASEFRVTVVTSNFFDDSVFASRLELMLRRDDVGRFRFVSGEWGQVCQPGRGQQEFSPELCI
ncbi:MAG: hypothetical protein R8G01_15295 [Ilumatobacteraceae bacterium]|nr:hypothetical protein [Ilumatobacteraceae bacterium]